MGELIFRTEDITPEMARIYLKTSAGNRRISDHTVDAYARDMKANKWLLNGEAIKFNERGQLVEGHHRLMAIIKANKTVKLSVLRGVTDGIVLFDRGRNRTLSDDLAIEGAEPWRRGMTISLIRTHYVITLNKTKATDSEIRDFEDRNADALKFVHGITTKGWGGNRKIIKKAAVLYGIFCAYAYGVPGDVILSFAEKLATGIINGDEESAVIILRDSLINKNREGMNTSMKRYEAYLTENALADFTKKKPRRKRYADPKPIYSGTELIKNL